MRLDYKSQIKKTSRPYKEQLVEYLLEASKAEHLIYISETNQECFQEASELLKYLSQSERKINLQFKREEIKINQLCPDNDNKMAALKRNIIEFEKHCSNTNKKTLKCNTDFSTAKQVQFDNICGIITESKRLLDRAMNLVKETVYNVKHDTIPYVYYPSPKRLDYIKKENIDEKMEDLLHNKYKLKGFSTKFPQLFEFLIEKQPDASKSEYKWLQDFIDIRNSLEHSDTASQVFEQKFQTHNEITEFSRNVYQYAIDVWRKFKKEVEQYNLEQRNNICNRNGK